MVGFVIKKDDYPARPRIEVPSPDMDQARMFFEALDSSPHAKWAFRSINDRGGGGATKMFGTLDRGVRQSSDPIKNGRACCPASLLQYMQTLGCGTFLMPNETDGHDQKWENVTRINEMYNDADTFAGIQGVSAFIKRTGLIPTAVVASGGVIIMPNGPIDKLHVYWSVKDMPLECFTRVQRALNERTAADPQVVDRSRVLRVPGYHHLKNEPRMTRIIELRPGLVYDAVDFVRRMMGAPVIAPAASASRPSGRTGFRSDRSSAGFDRGGQERTVRLRQLVNDFGGLFTPAVRRLVAEAVAPSNAELGTRHASAMAVVTRVAWERWPDQDIYDLLVPLADGIWGITEGGSWARDIERMVRWVRQREAQSREAVQ